MLSSLPSLDDFALLHDSIPAVNFPSSLEHESISILDFMSKFIPFPALDRRAITLDNTPDFR